MLVWRFLKWYKHVLKYPRNPQGFGGWIQASLCRIYEIGTMDSRDMRRWSQVPLYFRRERGIYFLFILLLWLHYMALAMTGYQTMHWLVALPLWSSLSDGQRAGRVDRAWMGTNRHNCWCGARGSGRGLVAVCRSLVSERVRSWFCCAHDSKTVRCVLLCALQRGCKVCDTWRRHCGVIMWRSVLV